MEIYIIQYIFIFLYVPFNVYCDVLPTPKVYDKAHMFALAVRIRSKILQPFGNGVDLLNDLKNYISELETLKKGVNDENTEAVNAFNRIMNQGGPQHLVLNPVDPKPLAKFYNWDEYTVKMFQDMFKQTLHTWNDLRVIAGLLNKEDTEKIDSTSNM